MLKYAVYKLGGNRMGRTSYKKRWYGSPIILIGMWISNLKICILFFLEVFKRAVFKSSKQIALVIGSALIALSLVNKDWDSFWLGFILICFVIVIEIFNEMGLPRFHNIWDFSATIRKKWTKEFKK